MSVYVVQVFRDGEWTMVGQYPSRRQARLIADDYTRRGERARVTTD